jgi:hypothetical protein
MLIMAGGHEGKPLDYDALERRSRAITNSISQSP